MWHDLHNQYNYKSNQTTYHMHNTDQESCLSTKHLRLCLQIITENEIHIYFKNCPNNWEMSSTKMVRHACE